VVAAHPDGHSVEHEDHLHQWIVVTYIEPFEASNRVLPLELPSWKEY